MIFVVPSNSGFSVISVTPAVPRLPDSITGAELVALAVPLVLCPSLPWLGLPSAFCCPAGVSGRASGVVVTSKWHCYPTACCPHPGPLGRAHRILLYLTTVPERSGCPSKKADLPHTPGSNSCRCFLSLFNDVGCLNTPRMCSDKRRHGQFELDLALSSLLVFFHSQGHFFALCSPRPQR